MDAEFICRFAGSFHQSGGYLLRTKIRAAIEFLDQLYQYGKAGNTTVNELGEETFEEDVPAIDDFPIVPKRVIDRYHWRGEMKRHHTA